MNNSTTVLRDLRPSHKLTSRVMLKQLKECLGVGHSATQHELILHTLLLLNQSSVHFTIVITNAFLPDKGVQYIWIANGWSRITGCE